MLGEGTLNHTAKQIAGYLDNLGAFIEYGHGMDRSGITVYCLNKHLANVLELLSEMLTTATFPAKELQNQQKQATQNLSINQEKTAYLANRVFKEKIFGAAHPYSFSLEESHISAISQEHLIGFYRQYYLNKPFKIFLSGNISDNHTQAIETFLGKHSLDAQPPQQQFISSFQGASNNIIPKENSVQTTIRIGKQLNISRKDDNYTKLLLANEVLGGYFGSRLMKNIREEKGLTYGISSSIPQMSKGSYFVIGTDVKAEFAALTVTEIKKEILELQNNLVDEEELSRAKSYLIGQYLGSINTPFEVMDRNKIMALEGLDMEFYDRYPARVHAITPADIMTVAQQYLEVETLTDVLVG